jgi:hypothetical protein
LRCMRIPEELPSFCTRVVTAALVTADPSRHFTMIWSVGGCAWPNATVDVPMNSANVAANLIRTPMMSNDAWTPETVARAWFTLAVLCRGTGRARRFE